jgi:hypothetical protein
MQSGDILEKENYEYKKRIRGFQELGDREWPVDRTLRIFTMVKTTPSVTRDHSTFVKLIECRAPRKPHVNCEL